MNDQRLGQLVGEWLRESCVPVSDPRDGVRQVIAQTADVSQVGAGWLSRHLDEEVVPVHVPTTNGRRPARGFTMISALQYIAAGVIVALFGGFLLAGLFTMPQGEEMAPAAVTTSPTTEAPTPPTDMGGTGILNVRVAGFPWDQVSGKELQGSVQGSVNDVDGALSAAIPGPSAEPPGPGTDPAGWTRESSVTARLDLDGQPVHLVPDTYVLVLALGEPGCLTGYNTACVWWCQTMFELRPDEDIWFYVTPFREVELPGGMPVAGATCPIDGVSHHAWAFLPPADE